MAACCDEMLTRFHQSIPPRLDLTGGVGALISVVVLIVNRVEGIAKGMSRVQTTATAKGTRSSTTAIFRIR